MDSNNRYKQSIDNFYKSKIEGGQIGFDPKAWDALENRLDDENQNSAIFDIISIWKKRWIPILLFMFIAATSVGYVMFLDNQKTFSSDLDNSQKRKQGFISDASKGEEATGILDTTEKNGELSDNDLKKGTSNPENQKGKALKKENEERRDETQLAQGGSVNGLNSRQYLQIDTEANQPNEKQTRSNQNASSDSTISMLDLSSKKANTTSGVSNTSAIMIEDNNAKKDNIISREFPINNNEQTERIDFVIDLEEDYTSNEINKNEGDQFPEVLSIGGKEIEKEVEFPFLPMLQFGLERNASAQVEAKFLLPTKVDILSSSQKTFYVKVGYGVSGPTGIADRILNSMASIGQDLKTTRNGSYGIELAYDRFRNESQYVAWIDNIFINAELNRDAIDLRSSFRWKPKQKRFSMTSLVGFGIERTSWDLESTLFHPFSTVVAAENSNRIYMKQSPFLSFGGDIGYDIIKNSLSFHISANYQYRLQDVEVNGILQGYRINTSENEFAYANTEERILRNENYVSIYLGLKFYIF